MPTLITVHGTFASGPDDGNAWWQRGSNFAQLLSGLIEHADGEFQHEPFGWNGDNSEAARRRAAKRLLARLVELDGRKEDCILIGHSHGGSVVAAALFEAAVRGKSLPHLKRWITVGTPFVMHSRNRLLFSRLGQRAKAAYMVFVYLLFIMVSYLGAMTFAEGEIFWGDIVLISPFAIAFFLLRRFQKADRYGYSKTCQQNAKRLYQDRWFGVQHEDDEAIQGLKSLERGRLNVFPKDFAVPFFSFTAVVALPLLLYIVTTSADAMEAIVGFAKSFDPRLELTYFETDKTAPAFIKNGFLLLALPAFVLQSSFEGFGLSFRSAEIASYFTTFFVVVGAIWLLSVVILQLITWLSMLLSVVLGRLLNVATWTQIHKSALGGDVVGETARKVENHPFWIDKEALILPPEIGQPITDHSNALAAIAFEKVRGALKFFMLTAPDGGASNPIDKYFTWNELIHTTYFAMPGFQTLIACAICQAEPFRARRSLSAQPGFDVSLKFVGGDKSSEVPAAGKKGRQKR